MDIFYLVFENNKIVQTIGSLLLLEPQIQLTFLADCYLYQECLKLLETLLNCCFSIPSPCMKNFQTWLCYFQVLLTNFTLHLLHYKGWMFLLAKSCQWLDNFLKSLECSFISIILKSHTFTSSHDTTQHNCWIISDKNIQWKTPVKFVPNNPFTLASRNYLFLLFCFVKIEHFLNNFNQISEQLSSVCGCTSSQLWSQDTLIISQPFSSRRSNTCLAQPINHHPAVLHQRLCGYQPQARESKNNLNHGQHCEKWLDCWLTPLWLLLLVITNWQHSYQPIRDDDENFAIFYQIDLNLIGSRPGIMVAAGHRHSLHGQLSPARLKPSKDKLFQPHQHPGSLTMTTGFWREK